MAKRGLKSRGIGYGRNDLCSCGSGLKYKKCCKPVARMKTDEELKADNERRNRSKGTSASKLTQFLQGMTMMNMQRRSFVDHGDLPERVRIDER